jgi:hypothetical protein
LLLNSSETILHKVKDQACYKSGIISPEYLFSEPEQGLDGIVAYVIIMVKIVGNGAKWVQPT